MLENNVFSVLLVHKMPKFPTLIWGEGGVHDPRQVSKLLLAEIVGDWYARHF